jgi:hypothetical protein
MGALEGPYPELGIIYGRWMVEKAAQVIVWCDKPGDCMLSIQFRNPQLLSKLVLNGVAWKVNSGPITKKVNLSVPFTAKYGWNSLKLEIRSLADEPGQLRKLGIFIDDILLSDKKLSDQLSPASSIRKLLRL